MMSKYGTPGRRRPMVPGFLAALLVAGVSGCGGDGGNETSRVTPVGTAGGTSVAQTSGGAGVVTSSPDLGSAGSEAVPPAGGAGPIPSGDPVSMTGGSSAIDSTVGGASNAGGAADAGGAQGGPTDPPATPSVPLDPTLLDSCTGTNPVVCAIPVSNGNYNVSVEFGSAAIAGASSIQSETRRFHLAETATVAGMNSLHSFTVNVRQEAHDGGQSAPGGILDLVIGGSAPTLNGLGIAPAPDAITVFVASDSTAADWDPINTSSLAVDEAGWAQELSLYLAPGVAVANYADSGETAASFYSKFFPAARDAMGAGDYLFIQFGHNDQKAQGDIDAYQANLMRYVDDARTVGAIPVLLTPVSRSGGSATNPGFAGVDQLARDLALAEDIALIDLTSLSRDYYASVPDLDPVFIDGTHFHELGAIGVAGVVAEAIRASDLGLSDFVR